MLRKSDFLSCLSCVPSWELVRLVSIFHHIEPKQKQRNSDLNKRNSRVLLLQGVAMPAMNNILSKWIPVSERSRSLALVYSGMYLGSVIGLGISPILIQKFAWPSVFYSFGSLGSVWFAFWLAKVSLFPPIFNSLVW